MVAPPTREPLRDDRLQELPTTGPLPVRTAAPTGVWLGVVAVAIVGVCLAVIGWRELASAGDLVSALKAARGQMVAPSLVGVVAAVFLAERRWPAVRRPALASAHLVDAAYLVLFALVVAPLFMLVETGFAQVVDRYARYLLVGKLSPVPQVLVVVVSLVAMDAGNWLAHVANHRSASLWRLHALHHSQEDMSVFTTFRTHPLMHVSYLPALIPILILGAGGAVPGGALIAYSCLVTLPHANLRWSFGPVGRIVVSPAYHRLHHASIPLDERMTVNFGFVLVCWDRLAHQALFPAGGPTIPTGIAGRPVPVEQSRAGFGVAGAFGAQLVQPFRLRRAPAGES